MKKTLALFLALLALCRLACAEESPAQSRILIAYFTWGDNTIVKRPEEVDVDVSTSASVLAPGNTAVMAGHIRDLVGGDLFSIQVEEPYSSVYDECLDRAADELDANARPALKTHVENMAQYDIVFLGIPNWWYSCPMAVLTFVEEYDFSGKMVIPFVAHGTGGISGSVRDMRASLPEDCRVLDPIGVYRPDVATCQRSIEEWISAMDVDWPVKAASNQSAPRVRLTIGETVLYAALEDNSASRSLLNQLPLTLSFEDYNGTEKIAYPPESLDVSSAPGNCDPAPGTLAYYAPWGNLCIFYRDCGPSNGLVPLGALEGGAEALGAIEGSFTGSLEALE